MTAGARPTAALVRVRAARAAITTAREEYVEAVMAALDEGFSPTEVGAAADVTEAAIRKTVERKEADG